MVSASSGPYSAYIAGRSDGRLYRRHHSRALGARSQRLAGATQHNRAAALRRREGWRDCGPLMSAACTVPMTGGRAGIVRWVIPRRRSSCTVSPCCSNADHRTARRPAGRQRYSQLSFSKAAELVRDGAPTPRCRPIIHRFGLRSACGSHRRPGLRAIAPGLSLCQDGVLRRQALAAAPVARSHAFRDVRRRSPAARSSSRDGDPQERRAPSPRRSQRAPSLQKSALTA